MFLLHPVLIFPLNQLQNVLNLNLIFVCVCQPKTNADNLFFKLVIIQTSTSTKAQFDQPLNAIRIL